MQLFDASFDDIDLLCERVREWDLEFHPLKSSNNGRASHITQFMTTDASFAQARFAMPLTQFGSPPPDCITFVILDRDMKRLWWRGHDVDASTVLAFPIGSELQCFSGPDFSVHTLSYPQATVAKIAAALDLDPPDKSRHREVFHVPASVLDVFRAHLAALRDRKLPVERLRPLAILEGLLPYWIRGAQPETGRLADGRIRSRAVRLSLEAIESDDLTDWSPARLRELCNVSERTLQYAFRERFGLTPARFLKARRMANVRRALRLADPGKTLVGDVMGEHGFWHVGQFARDYRSLFGELPSETLCAR